MEDNHYDNNTDDYYDDDSDTTIMDLSDICDKSDDSEEENERPFRVSICKEKKYVHEYCALYTYVCSIKMVQIVNLFFKT